MVTFGRRWHRIASLILRFPDKNLFFVDNFKPVALQIPHRCFKHGEGLAAGNLASEFSGSVQACLDERILPAFSSVFFSRCRNDRFMLEGAYMDIGENFNPEVGFVQRKGVRRLRTDMRYTPWPGVLGIRRIITGPEIGLFFDPDGEVVTRILTLSDWVNFESDDWLQFGAQRIMERLDEDFEVHEGFVIPAGEHHFNKYAIGIFTDRAEKISGYFRLNLGGFFNGDKRGFESGANFNPSPQVLIESRYQFNRVTLPDGSFNTHVVGTRAVYSVSTTLFGKLYAQWNSSRDVVSTNFLLNYIYNPGSDFYLVFNQNYDSGGAAIRHIDSTLVGKMTYWWNL